ncbi:MAG: radical SAM family heme chaperone HemW [Lachnospiraceae bacterium]|nr:radical SAM family heme chaperone HemW [Lachnospiraceae bacterium]
MIPDFELYIHIPFCVRKCAYCDFLSAPASEDVRERYVQALCREIRESGESLRDRKNAEQALCREIKASGESLRDRKKAEQALCREIKASGQRKTSLAERTVSTVFFGGGTPSILEAGQIERIMKACREAFLFAENAEVSLEANPGTLTMDKLEGYRRAGINRLSLGLQSVHENELRLLGRIHSYDDFLESYRLARKAGFTNINVDLMSALPGQTWDSYRECLEQVTALAPEHISAYSLIVEEGTLFYERYGDEEKRREAGKETLLLPSEEEEREMYENGVDYLRKAGYRRYEISNFAREGYVCRHNCGYWTGAEYLGLGLGASSYMEGTRFSNVRDLKRYLEAEGAPALVRELPEVLSEEEKKEEFFFLGLRMMQGVSASEFERRFGESWEREYGASMQKLIRMGYLKQEGDRLFLTEEGVSVSNEVFAELLL